jgi:parallel beta-helix repeat protein
MNRKLLSLCVLTLFLTFVSSLSLRVQKVGANGTVYIRADGSIDPPTAPISSAGNITYTFTDNIRGDADGIVVERDNIVVDGAGYVLQGADTYGFKGIALNGFNVTLKNLQIEQFYYGVYLGSLANGNSIQDNNSTDSVRASIYLSGSWGNNISRNSISYIDLQQSYQNVISGNSVKGGINLYSGYGNTILENNIVSSTFGIEIGYSLGNSILENNVSNCETFGISIAYCDYSTIHGNFIANSSNAIQLYCSTHTVASENIMKNNSRNFNVYGYEFDHYANSIDVSNLVDGRPVYYIMNQQNLVINHTTHPDVGYMALINCTNVEVRALTLTNNEQGILLAYTNDSMIVENRIANNGVGVELEYSSTTDNIITENNITDNDIGIYVTRNNTALKNRVANNGQGILVVASENTILSNNITHNEVGICVNQASNNTILDNEIVSNSYGLILCYSSSFNKVSTNNITDSINNGIQLLLSDCNKVFRNSIRNNGIGIGLDSSFNNTVNENVVTNNSYGIELGYNQYAVDNKIYHNSFLNNTEQTVFNEMIPQSKAWDNGYPSGGNFWSDYSGQDDNGDGIGDSAYVINEFNQDRYPLMEPYGLDLTAPIIGTPSRKPSDGVQPDQLVKVSVNVTDIISGVKNVTLYYSLNNGTSWEEPTPMTLNSSTSLYEANIPGQSLGTWVKYKIVAYDIAGNNATLEGTQPYLVYQVVPEFPSLLILPLFMMTTLLSVIVYRRKHQTSQIPEIMSY